jgi:hypothetical protein
MTREDNVEAGVVLTTTMMTTTTGGAAEMGDKVLLHYWIYLGTYIGTYLPTSIPLELSDTFQHIPANPMKSVTL